MEARAVYYGKIYVGERRNDAIFIGVDDFSDQQVDRIPKKEGQFPISGEILTDSGNVMNNIK